MENLPANTPTELVELSPEALEIANCYLQLQDVREVSSALGVSVQICTQYLQRREVKQYIDWVYYETGFNNRYRMRDAMDALLKQKFQDLDESQTGSSKDIADLLELSHKMRMQELDRELALEKLRASANKTTPKTQVNMQINEAGGSNYMDLISRLLEDK